jgi:hypothetical protein
MIDDLTAPEESRFVSLARLTLGLRLLAIATFLFIALKIAGAGFLPPDDVRRHVARAICDKPYTDILVLRPEYKINHSPGWDALLGALHTRAGWDEDALVVFSVVALAFWLLCMPLPWLRCPEAWLAALLFFNVAAPGNFGRIVEGRPFVLTEGVLLAVLLAWRKPGPVSWLKIILTAGGFALSVYIHGAWYLWAVVPLAFFLAGQRPAACALGLCWVAGALIGASLTGHPVEFLHQGVALAGVIARENAAKILLVGEFQPSGGAYSQLAVLAMMFIWRRGRAADLFGDVLFWMTVICWVLGLGAVRYWEDWGAPAAMLWLALQLEEVILGAWSALPLRRLAAGALLALSLYWCTTADLNGRWTDCLRETFVDGSEPALQSWMPAPGGIFYSTDMNFFYSTFYHNPNGPWRYLMGFEPAWMPPDDLKVARDIQWTKNAWSAYIPWVKKLRPQDRLEVTGGPKPNMPPLEFTNATDTVWIGRLPNPRPQK